MTKSQKYYKKDSSEDNVSNTNSTSSTSELQGLDRHRLNHVNVVRSSLMVSPQPVKQVSQGSLPRSRQKDQIVIDTIKQAKDSGSSSVDLSRKELLAIPEQLFEIDNLEYLYLEGNGISSLPVTFFHEFPYLKWLDLRRNKLSQLPTAYTGQHKYLKNLLLEGNCLKNLPLELGLIKSLNGLNIRDNPLEFPPPEIVEKGTVEILKFLRDTITAKSDGFMINGNGNLHDSCSSDDWNEDLQEYSFSQLYDRSMSMGDSADGVTHDSIHLVGPFPKTAELHQPVSYTDMKQVRVEKLRKAGAMGTVDSYLPGRLLHRRQRFEERKLYMSLTHAAAGGFASCRHCELRHKPSSLTNVRSWKGDLFPCPPPAEYVDFKMNEERKLAQVQDLREKQDAILQRRRDEQVLKDWRDESRRQQQQKSIESLHRGSQDTIDIALHGSFAVEKENLRIPSNEERIKQDVKAGYKKMRRTLSPVTRQRIEIEKSARIQELERRIKHHTALMHERRKQPKGTPQEEIVAAKRELEIAEELHRELMKRKDLEYRFRAFTADIGSSISRRVTIQQLNI